MIAILVVLSACSRKPDDPRPRAGTASTAPAPVRITMFYASPEHPPADEKTLLCYGVENADEVRLEPAVDRVWPALTRCVEAPARAATYTLTASRGSQSVSRTLSVAPVPPKVKLIEVSINKLEINPGDEITICYKAKNSRITIVKPGFSIGIRTPNAGCVIDKPLKTTTYLVTALGAGDDADSEQVTAKVKP